SAAASAGTNPYPDLGSYTTEEFTRTFYDDYSWVSSYSNPVGSSYVTSYDSYLQTASNSTWPYPQANTATTNTIGLVTGTRIKVLRSSTYLYTSNFYDANQKIIQVQSTNLSRCTDIITTQYDWAGQPLIMIQRHEKSSPNSQTTIVVTQLTYDDLGRLLKVEK